jgi:glycine/D-amino acid oxidase-like deaminating enzyme
MDLRSPYPYWLLRHGTLNNYPSLQKNIQTSIAVIGAGISGALVARELINAGHAVTVIDRRHAGTGSTAASTGLLQYEIDTPLYKLINLAGEKNAVRSYILCREAIYELEKIGRQLKAEELVRFRPSLQYASYRSHIKNLEKEYRLRENAGFDLQWMDGHAIKTNYGFEKPAGLLSADGAEADAYRITHCLLTECINLGAKVFDNTRVTEIRYAKNGVELATSTGFKVKARKLVIACGYESQRYIPKQIQHLQSTFAIVSEPFAEQDFWFRNSLIWETRKPYLYLRTSNDRRILVGGKDVDWSDPQRRNEWLPKKARALEKAFKKLFPRIPFKTDFKWAGTFASTRDGLPYIGSIPERPHTYFALGFGGNGITFSVVAASIIRDMIEGKKNSDAVIFSFNR